MPKLQIKKINKKVQQKARNQQVRSLVFFSPARIELPNHLFLHTEWIFAPKWCVWLKKCFYACQRVTDSASLTRFGLGVRIGAHCAILCFACRSCWSFPYCLLFLFFSHPSAPPGGHVVTGWSDPWRTMRLLRGVPRLAPPSPHLPPPCFLMRRYVKRNFKSNTWNQ